MSMMLTIFSLLKNVYFWLILLILILSGLNIKNEFKIVKLESEIVSLESNLVAITGELDKVILTNANNDKSMRRLIMEHDQTVRDYVQHTNKLNNQLTECRKTISRLESKEQNNIITGKSVTCIIGGRDVQNPNLDILNSMGR